MENISLKQTVNYIIRNPFLKLTAFVFLFVSVGLFLIQSKVVFPLLAEMQKTSIESEAARTANHLRDLLQIDNEPVFNDPSAGDRFQDLQKSMKIFELVKIKIFNTTGLVVYSSDLTEIGEINTHDYFHKQVAKGQIFSKIVEKNQASMEGKLVPTSVAEVYVPILNNANFQGAFEIYYDITEQNRTISKNEFILKVASLSTWLILTLVCFSLLIKASRANILKASAEKELNETNHWLERTVTEKTQEIKVTQIVSVQALAILAEYYDQDTGVHLERIQLYVRTLLEYLASSSNRYTEYVQRHPGYIEEIVFASLLHDIGKTAIPVEILIKPGKLTPEEFDAVKNHTTIAGEALDKANQVFREEFGKDSYLALARDIAIYHHEKWNGDGYPHRLKGAEIPLSARITAIADVYDALTSERPYKKAWTHEKAVEEIVNGSGTHFEPELVEAFKHCREQFKGISENTASKS